MAGNLDSLYSKLQEVPDIELSDKPTFDKMYGNEAGLNFAADEDILGEHGIALPRAIQENVTLVHLGDDYICIHIYIWIYMYVCTVCM